MAVKLSFNPAYVQHVTKMNELADDTLEEKRAGYTILFGKACFDYPRQVEQLQNIESEIREASQNYDSSLLTPLERVHSCAKKIMKEQVSQTMLACGLFVAEVCGAVIFTLGCIFKSINLQRFGGFLFFRS